jgi:hypothetical protein
LPKARTFLYPKIHCPYCGFFTTAAEKLGPHMVDKHAQRVVRGYHKVKKTSETPRKT